MASDGSWPGELEGDDLLVLFAVTTDAAWVPPAASPHL